MFEAVKSSYFSRVKMREGFRRELMSMEIIIACTTLLIQVDGPYNNQEGALVIISLQLTHHFITIQNSKEDFRG